MITQEDYDNLAEKYADLQFSYEDLKHSYEELLDQKKDLEQQVSRFQEITKGLHEMLDICEKDILRREGVEIIMNDGEYRIEKI